MMNLSPKKSSFAFKASYILLFFTIILSSCGGSSDSLFKQISAEESGIQFENKLENADEMNYFNYRNFYNGGGVAIGDINNDGLSDVYLVSNQGENKLYLNKGNFRFEDITKKAGVGGKKAFSTGAVMADVNGDGWLDIYVCNSGEVKTDDRANELFINKQNGTFEEKAAEYGLDDKGYSTHAAFFDYDLDGDLDMFLLENSSIPVNKLGLSNIRNKRDALAGQKLFRNDTSPPAPRGGVLSSNSSPSGGQGAFVDVSESAGIYGSLIGFGLGITIGDVNNDLYPDIYISNDFYEKDYLYINQKNGTFSEQLENQMGHISMSSMGADVADINNDGNLDIFSTDMLPLDDYRLKTTMVYDDYIQTNIKVDSGFYYQYSRNMLQLNNGDNTFSEVGALAGVHATDWSWGALIFDMDNDGQKDLFVANGIYKNVTDQDFVQFLNDEETMRPYREGQKKFSYKDFAEKTEVKPISNYAFKNNGSLNFTNQAKDWGLAEPSFTSGAAYGDLDNDGDLDLILNNTNQPVGIFKNQSVEKNKTNFLKVNLKGYAKNTLGIGTKVKLYNKGEAQTLEQMPNRGFESSVDYSMVFGLGQSTQVDSVVVIWIDGKKQIIKNPKVNSTLTLDYKNANLIYNSFQNTDNQRFVDITSQSNLNFIHQENYFVDYDRDALLKQMYSRMGPALAVGDVNNDGLEDAFFGAANGGLKKLFIQNQNGQFIENSTASLNSETNIEVVSAQFFDADNDKDLDLLMVTGGNDNYPNDPTLADYLFLNDGKGNFMKDTRFPQVFESGASAAIADIDADGDLDIFVGGRLVPAQYGMTPKHHLYRNQGGIFKVEEGFLPKSESIGMITDATWSDLDNDRYPELILTQDWGGIVVCQNQKGKKLAPEELENTKGWWNRIKSVDLDNDGDMDFVVGNMGRNNRILADENAPAELWAGDFDGNLRIDQIITCASEDGGIYPMILKNDLQKQIPAIKKKFVFFKDFGKKRIDEVFSNGELKGATKRTVNQRNSGVLINEKGKLRFETLPLEAQFSPIYGIEILDYNNDKLPDLMLTGNYFDTQAEWGKFDANYGQILLNKGKNQFQFIPSKTSGFFVKGQVRNLQKIKIKGKNAYILAKNNDKVQVIGF
jgi:enediyne biosynthesis protein E4